MRYALLALILLGVIGCEPAAVVSDREPVECTLEPVAVEDGVSSYQYHSFSPDGRTIAIGWDRDDEARGTYLLDLETGERTDVPEFNSGAVFSPDGRMLVNAVYVDNGKTDIAEMDIATREFRIIAPHAEWDWLPSYSPDGSLIVFNSYRSGGSDIYVYDRADASLRQMTNTDQYEAHAQFSPDGTRIVFHRQEGESDYNIYVLDVASGEERQITDSPREESYPSWAADGEHIFFSSDEGNEPGKTNIAVMTDRGEVIRRLTDHPDKDAYAFASPDGDYLYFNSYREAQGVYRMKIGADFECK